MRIAEITMFILVILLTLSVGMNVFQYTGKRPIPEPVIIQVSDTVVRVDTIIHTITHQVSIDKPVPVYIDTVSQVKTYRDTIYYPFGMIRHEHKVHGEILKYETSFDIVIPEIINSKTITNNSIQTIRSSLLFVSGGIRYSPYELNLIPTIGLFGIFPGHRLGVGIDFGFDRSVSVNVGLRIQR